VLYSLISAIRKWLIPYATLRGKGSVNVAELMEEKLRKMRTEEFSNIIKIETDLTDATFRAKRVTVEKVVEVVRDAFTKKMSAEELRLATAGWDRQSRPSKIVKFAEGVRKPAAPSLEFVSDRAYRERNFFPPECFSGLETAISLLKDFVKERENAKKFLGTIDAIGEAWSMSTTGMVVLKASAGSGKTVTSILLAYILSSFPGFNGVWLVLTTRDSVNSILRSLGLHFVISSFGSEEEREEGPYVNEDGLIDLLYEFAKQRGILLHRDPSIGARHRWIKGSQRDGRIIISTPRTFIGEMRRKSSKINLDMIIVDEVEQNAASVAFASGRGTLMIGMSATPPPGLVPTEKIISVKGNYVKHPFDAKSTSEVLSG